MADDQGFLFADNSGRRWHVTAPPGATLEQAQDKLKELQGRMPQLSGDLSAMPDDLYAQMIEGRAARRQERRASVPMPPEATQEQVGKTFSALGQTGRDIAMGLPRAAKTLTESAMTNVPGQDPRYLTETVQQAADVARQIPMASAAGGMAMRGAEEAAGGIDVGMFKAYPKPKTKYAPKSYEIYGHEADRAAGDEPLGEVQLTYNPETKKVAIGWLGTGEDTALPATSRAAQLNEGAYTFGSNPMEAASNIRALQQLAKDEFPEATHYSFVRSSGTMQRMGTQVRRFPPGMTTTYEQMKGTPEYRTPEHQEMESELGRMGRESIRQFREIDEPRRIAKATRRWGSPDIAHVRENPPGRWAAFSAAGKYMADGETPNQAIRAAVAEGASYDVDKVMVTRAPQAPRPEPYRPGGARQMPPDASPTLQRALRALWGDDDPLGQGPLGSAPEE
jgi:hypothetical protein